MAPKQAEWVLCVFEDSNILARSLKCIGQVGLVVMLLEWYHGPIFTQKEHDASTPFLSLTAPAEDAMLNEHQKIAKCSHYLHVPRFKKPVLRLRYARHPGPC